MSPIELPQTVPLPSDQLGLGEELEDAGYSRAVAEGDACAKELQVTRRLLAYVMMASGLRSLQVPVDLAPFGTLRCAPSGNNLHLTVTG